MDAQVQPLDSGMLVVGGDQATILAHLQAGGVRGAEPFAGVTLVPVDQAALAQQVLSRPHSTPAGTQVRRKASQPPMPHWRRHVRLPLDCQSGNPRFE
jgi:hypothetical protein